MKKLLLVSVMMIVGAFLLPITVLAAEIEPEPVTTIFGVDLTQSLFAGLSAALTTLASVLVVFRKLKTKVSTLGTSTDAFLIGLKDRLEQVVSGEVKITEFVGDMEKFVGDMRTAFTNAIADLKSENNFLKEEITLVKEQFPVFVQLASDIKKTEANIEAMLKIGFGNMKELVVNGYAKQIFQVGEVTPDESEG